MSTNQSLEEALERKLQAEETDYLTMLKKTQGISNLRKTLQKGEEGPPNWQNNGNQQILFIDNSKYHWHQFPR